MVPVVGSFPCSDETFWGGSNFSGRFDVCCDGGFLMVLVMVEAVDTLISHDLVVGGYSFLGYRWRQFG